MVVNSKMLPQLPRLKEEFSSICKLSFRIKFNRKTSHLTYQGSRDKVGRRQQHIRSHRHWRLPEPDEHCSSRPVHDKPVSHVADAGRAGQEAWGRPQLMLEQRRTKRMTRKMRRRRRRTRNRRRSQQRKGGRPRAVKGWMERETLLTLPVALAFLMVPTRSLLPSHEISYAVSRQLSGLNSHQHVPNTVSIINQ